MRFSLVFHHCNKEFVSLESAEERQSWKTSAHTCGWLFLARFRSFDQWKFSLLPLTTLFLRVISWRFGDGTGRRLRKIQFKKKSDIPHTSCVESFRARKQIFQKLYTLKNFRRLKLEQTLIFSLLTLFFHRWFFSRQSWKTSVHACSWLFLARFRSFDQWKFSNLKDVVFAGDFLAITTFDKMELEGLVRTVQFNEKSLTYRTYFEGMLAV